MVPRSGRGRKPFDRSVVCNLSTSHGPISARSVINPLSRVMANFFIGINKPLKPTKLFDDRDKAIAWLQQQQSTFA